MQSQGTGTGGEVPPPPPGALPEAAATSAEAMAATLAATPPVAMSQTAAAVASGPPLGGVPPPTLSDCILCDHSQVLTLFNHFFQAAQTGNPLVMDMCVCALALEMRLHSQVRSTRLCAARASVPTACPSLVRSHRTTLGAHNRLAWAH